MFSNTQNHYFIHIILIVYVVSLFFGSLHPITSWQWPELDSWIGSFEKETRYTPQSDLIINFIIYVPLGILSSLIARNHMNTWRLFFTVSLLLALFSLTIETLQLFVPSRAQSLVDFAMNSAGGTTGTILYLILSRRNILGFTFSRWRYLLFYRGRFFDLGLLAIFGWCLSELNPFLPTLNLKEILKDITQLNIHEQIVSIDILKTAGFAFEIFTLIAILKNCLRSNHNILLLTLTLGLTLILLKFPVKTIAPAMEELMGLFLAAAFYFIFSRKIDKSLSILAIYSALFSFAISQLNHPPLLDTQQIKALNWIPFYFQFNRLNQIQEILETFWCFSAISFLAIGLHKEKIKLIAGIGAITTAVLTFALEYEQQYLRIASPDITNVLIAVGVWIIPLLHPQIRILQKEKPAP